jgi:hypothetical protein
MKTLVIDDLRSVKPDLEPVTYARTPDAGVVELMIEDWELVLLDHDLGIDYGNGADLDIWPCIDFIERHPEKFKNTIFYVITSNPWGAQRMQQALEACGLTAFYISQSEKSELFVA